jgi:hypothetical protein
VRGQVLKRDHDVSEMTTGEMEGARRDLEASLALARPGSMTSVPIMAQIRAIDAALAGLNRPADVTALLGSPLL